MHYLDVQILIYMYKLFYCQYKDRTILKKVGLKKNVQLNVIGIVSIKFSCKFCIQWSTYEKYYDFYGDSKGNLYRPPFLSLRLEHL